MDFKEDHSIRTTKKTHWEEYSERPNCECDSLYKVRGSIVPESITNSCRFHHGEEQKAIGKFIYSSGSIVKNPLWLDSAMYLCDDCGGQVLKNGGQYLG